METTETYTLDEAKRELARRECAWHGHSWDVIETMARPVAIVCYRCGASYAVKLRETQAVITSDDAP